MEPLADAHCHLHDPRLAPSRPDLLAAMRRAGVGRACSNGTREADWPLVAALAREHPWVIPSFGLHPWFLRDVPSGWETRLREAIAPFAPRAGVGEIGLDRNVREPGLDGQRHFFRGQMAVAAALDLPLSIHCAGAWGALLEDLRAGPLPRRGFLLHAFSGSRETAGALLDLGGYFSFNPAFLLTGRARLRELFAHLPAERLLVESDAPSPRPPGLASPWNLPVFPEEKPLTHPADVALALEGLAAARNQPPAEMARITSENFARLFGEQAPAG